MLEARATYLPSYDSNNYSRIVNACVQAILKPMTDVLVRRQKASREMVWLGAQARWLVRTFQDPRGEKYNSLVQHQSRGQLGISGRDHGSAVILEAVIELAQW